MQCGGTYDVERDALDHLFLWFCSAVIDVEKGRDVPRRLGFAKNAPCAGADKKVGRAVLHGEHEARGGVTDIGHRDGVGLNAISLDVALPQVRVVCDQR